MYCVALCRFAAPLALLFSIFVGTPASALEAHIFRGLGDFTFVAPGLSFSEGMDKLADEFSAAGVPSKSYRWNDADAVYRDIMRRKPAAVALVGHSMGAIAVLGLARRLEGSGVRVAYLGTIDVPGPANTVPRNVEVAENYYSVFPVFAVLKKPRGFKGTLKNEFVVGQAHITVDNARSVHRDMLAAVGGSKAPQPQPLQTLQAYAPEVQKQPSEDVMAKVEAFLNAHVAASGAEEAVKAGYVGVDTDLVETAGIQGAAANGSIEVAAEPKRYKTKSGLPPIE